MNRRRYSIFLAIGFLLGVYEGHIALWKDGSAEPAEVFPFRVEMLPPADQNKLCDGIRIKNPEQLAGLIEDYLS